MNERPILNKDLDGKTFRSFYYLKEELVIFCRENNLPVSGGKLELTDRIAHFLDTGKVSEGSIKRKTKTNIKYVNKMLNVLKYLNVVEVVGKDGRKLLYNVKRG